MQTIAGFDDDDVHKIFLIYTRGFCGGGGIALCWHAIKCHQQGDVSASLIYSIQKKTFNPDNWESLIY